MAPVQRHGFDDDFDPGFEPFYDEDDYVLGDESGEDEEQPGRVASDETLENVVKEIIHNSKRLADDDITVSVSRADVTLNGTVRTEDEKNTAGALAQLVHGIGIIKNNIIVKLNEGILPTDIGRKG